MKGMGALTGGASENSLLGGNLGSQGGALSLLAQTGGLGEGEGGASIILALLEAMAGPVNPLAHPGRSGVLPGIAWRERESEGL